MSGVKACVEALKREDVKVAFGIPGGAILPFYDELRDSPIRHILARHEQCAAHMADGYARASGKVGVCVATSGPGATNMVTGIATAYMDSSPVVAITGQVPLSMVGRDAFQEADIIGITHPVVKHSYQPTHPREIPPTIKAAFHIASTGRPGPVVVDLPRDVQVASATVEFPRTVNLAGYKPTTEPHPLQLKKAVELLRKAERPIALAGGGAITSNSTPELMALAERLKMPVTTTFLGKGAIPEDHPMALGKIGLYGNGGANHALCEADVILTVGVRFSDRTIVTFDKFAPNAKVIHIDIDPAEIGKNVDIDVPIVADATLALRGLMKTLAKYERQEPPASSWLARVKELKQEFDNADKGMEGITSPGILKLLRKLLPRETIATADVGLHQMWTAIAFDCYSPRSFISSGGLGPMGFSFPASVGAKVAYPNKPVVCLTGDGGFLMTQAEMATSIEEGLPVIVVIFNNRTLGMVAQLQRLFWGKRYYAVDLGKSPDFVKLAQAYGAEGRSIQSYDEFEKAVKEGLKSEVSTVIDVPISPDENLPIVPPGMSLDSQMLEG
ncbi:MAG: biosynthetic-type acetolactate synthase large subunit [Candidatus Bathyarchaeia archaeon]